MIGCSSTPIPPLADKIAKVDTIHGDVLTDNYFWLRERDNPKVIAYLEAENAYTDAMMKPTDNLQKELFEEMKGRINETDLDVPVQRDSFFYYTRSEEGKQYKIYCRNTGEDSEEEILLDLNAMSTGYDYYDLGAYEVSHDHTLLAYSIDTAGGEHYTLYFKSLITGEILADKITDCDYPVKWAADNKTIFYPTLDQINRPDKIFRHELGTERDADVMVFHEPDEVYSVYLTEPLSREYLFLEVYSIAATEYHYLDANDPTGEFRVIEPRRDNIEYFVGHRGNYFYIMTNEDATNFKLMKTFIKKPARRYWKSVIPHRKDVLITGIELFGDYLVVNERKNGLSQIRIVNLTKNEFHYVEFPEPVYDIRVSGNKEFDTDNLRFTYQSLVTPKTIFDYDMKSREREKMKQYEVLGGFSADEYLSERIFAEASDGTKVPISLVYKKAMKKDGGNPLYLYGYGAYGMAMDPYFSSRRLSLLDRGFVYAIAHVRGGNEMGRHWYDDGKLLNKKNTFTDFISCAEHLIAEGYTKPDRLTAGGGSAGGLLMGVILNMRPDLFNIVVADVPFIDVINTMLDPTIPLTVNEYTEWGNPENEEYYRYMLSYSPYDNVEAKAYPNILITAGLNDPRVQYWEPAKWTAKLRAHKTDTNRLLLKTNMGAGHGGASGRYDYLKEIAFEYAFILDLTDTEK
ncbi:MAG: S9 family peptidase [FCB group bacterium]|nr:S9 family peptidase [FCB group bacterium]